VIWFKLFNKWFRLYLTNGVPHRANFVAKHAETLIGLMFR
jgi:hypothetical protein